MGAKEQWGKGYAKEASEVVIEFCFKTLALQKINLGVIENNKNAVSLYKKLGFDTYQVIRKYGYYDENESNLIRMTLQNGNEE
jgi:RimJ/RimL family protein N-acetyltransferase